MQTRPKFPYFIHLHLAGVVKSTGTASAYRHIKNCDLKLWFARTTVEIVIQNAL